MQSFSLLPPILESQLEAVQYYSSASEHVVEISFVLSQYAVFDDIGHIQVSIREKTTNNIAVNINNSPDQQVLYFPASDIQYDATTNICSIAVPYSNFSGGNLMANVEYNIQIRFGAATLWSDANDFPAWRAAQVSGGAFGEWSNTTTLFCYSGLTVSAEQDQDSFTPNISFSYSLRDIDDSVEKIAVQYQYQDFYQHGTDEYTTGNLIVNSAGKLEGDGLQSIQFELPIARISDIDISIDGYSQKNIKVHPSLSTIAHLTWQVIDGGIIENITPTLSAEEQNDGGLWFRCVVPQDITDDISYNIWRTNLHTFEAVKLFDTDKTHTMSGAFEFKFADFSVEMGEDYIYSVIVKQNGVNKLLTPLKCDYSAQGYGRLMKMDSVLLTTNTHQLRLQGNVKLSGLKRNTSDAFQTTVGGQYPFYSRGSLMNYRTFNIEGLITILFDKTSKFLSNDEKMGLRWVDNNKIVILNRDIYHKIEYTRNTRRINTKNPILKGTIDVDITNDERGPISKNENYVFESKTMFDDTSHTDEMIYIERKFREYVMQWLSDGKPKLFRSETEGNMIVILTGVNFTPYDASGRMVYQMSCSATEIAEYNNENLRKYNLLSTNLLIAENAEEEYKISKIDPDLGMLWVDNDAEWVEDMSIFHNGSGEYWYNAIENVVNYIQGSWKSAYGPLTNQTVIDYIAQYNEVVESSWYMKYTSQPIIYMKILYGTSYQDEISHQETDYYADLHHNKFVGLEDFITQYQEDSSNSKLKKLLATLIKNDILDIADYPELELLAIQANYIDWVVDLQYRSLFKKFGFGLSLYQLRNLMKNEDLQATVFNLINDYFSIYYLPFDELCLIDQKGPDPEEDQIEVHFMSDAQLINGSESLPTNNGIYLLIDQYRNGNQIALWEIHSTATTPLTVSVSEE